mmetsp:Transcript_78079/g.242067  ORF Transcript_78079/g.242067 Transcript_78079/m.242067 type:complete len:276 (-) Transcript_78079:153-980(-)
MALVVARREDAGQEVLVHDLEARAVLLRLVAPDDEAQSVARAEGLGHVPAELVDELAARRGVHAEDGALVALTVLYGIRPHDGLDPAELAGVEALFVERPRHVHQILEVPNAVAQAAMHGEHAAGDGAGQGQVGEDILDQGVDAIAHLLAQQPVALVPESVLVVHQPVLVIAPHQPDSMRHDNLHGEEQAYHGKLVHPAIHKVAVEDHMQVLLSTGVPKGVEEQQHVAKLSVDVAEDPAGHRGLGQHGLPGDDLAGRLGQEHEGVHVLRAEELRQ